jgi:hypothetical protein
MNLTELKKMPVNELVDMAQTMLIEGVGRSRKQDLIFAILKAHAKKGEEISGDGVLEILQDGFGFLRAGDSSYLAGPDDIYVSPSQIRRFNLRTAIPSPARFAPPRKASAILRCSRSMTLTSTGRKRPRPRFSSRTSRRSLPTSVSSSNWVMAAPRILPPAPSTWCHPSAGASAVSSSRRRRPARR